MLQSPMRRSKSRWMCFTCQAIGIAFSFGFAALNVARAAETNVTATMTNTATMVRSNGVAPGAVDTARFSDQPAPLDLKTFPERPPPLLEFGDKFLGTGNLQKGITLPTGEVISPNFWVFGTLRSAIQSFDPGTGEKNHVTEWANRLDIY